MNSRDSVPPQAQASSNFVWPPMIYGTATIFSAVLTWLAPLSFMPKAALVTMGLIGIAVSVAGVLIVFGAAWAFRRAGTPVAPIKPTTALVSEGIYRRTRNPMYLGLSVMLLGLGLATGSLWFLIGLAVAMLAVTKLAIEKEEAYLAHKFAAAYLDYKSRVRRWI